MPVLRFNKNKVLGSCLRREGAGGFLCWAKSIFAFLCVFYLFFAANAHAAQSDLVVVGSLSVSPNPITAGSTLTVGISIKNQGSGDAPVTTTRLQIKNTVLTAVADQPYLTPAIAAGQTITQSYDIIIPAGTATGNYNAYVVLDRDNVGNQSDVSNDYGASNVFAIQSASGTSDTTPPIISAFSVTPSSLTVGSPFTISYTVSDTGGSGLWQMQLWRTTDSNGVPNSSNWTKIKVDNLSGNGPVSGSFTDAPALTGAYWYGGHGVDSAINIGYEPSGLRVVVNAATGTLPATPTGASPGDLIGPGPVLSNYVIMNWNTVSGASDYNLVVTDITTNTQVLNFRVLGNTYMAMSLTAGHQYSWQVAACNTSGCSPYTAAQYYQTPVALPDTPTGTIPGSLSGPGPVMPSSTVKMDWNTVSGVGVDYNLIVEDITSNAQALNIRLPGNTYTLSLTADHQYFWQVTACNTSGCSPYTAAQFYQTPPVAPPGTLTLYNDNPICDLSVSAVPAVRLNWTPSSYASSYQVYRNGTAVGPAKNRNASSSYEIGLVAGQSYNYKVVASNALGNANSSTITVTIPANICTNTTNTQSGSSINGTVMANGNPLNGVTINASGSLNSSDVTVNGSYAFPNVSLGTVTLAPSLAGYSFDPSYRTISLATPSIINQPFRACANGSSLSGTVRDPNAPNVAISGVVTVDGNPATFSNGAYTVSGLACGQHRVTITAPGYFDYVADINTFDSWTKNIELNKNSYAFGAQTNSAYAADPVNTATGNYIYQRQDVKLPGRGMPFVFERNYNSQAGSEAGAVSGPLGFGWTHNYNTSLSVDASGNVTINWGDGKTETHTSNGIGGFTQQYGVFDTLIANIDGSYTLHKKDHTEYRFNVGGRLATIVDRNGNTIALTYTGVNLTQVTDTAGRNIDFTYDAGNRIVSITDPIARTVQFTYDAAGDLVTAQDANGNVTYYTYDLSHQMLTVVDSRGNTVVSNVYDATKRVVNSQQDAKAGQTDYVYSVYDGDKRLTTFTDALGHVTQHYHDEKYRLVKEVNDNGDFSLYTYDAKGNRNIVVDKNNNKTTYTYDSNGNVTSKEDAFGNMSSVTYDTNNNPLDRTDALNNKTSFTYDANGNLLTVTDALNNTATNTYNAAGQVLTTTDARNATTTNTYDAQGNLVQVQDALGNSTFFTYDGAGRRLTKRDALGRVTSYSYDNNDNLLSSTDSDLKSATATYDGNNNRITASDKRGNVTRFIYDVKDLLTTTTDPLLKTVVNSYDAQDRKIAVQDKNNNTTQFAYDGVGNVLSTTDALSQVTRYSFDANGNRLSATDPLNHASSFTYDALNRQVTARDALGNLTSTVYDELSRVISVINAKNQTTSFTYDKIGRLIQVTDANNGTVKYDYDANGNRVSMTDPNNHITGYTYDALNRLIAKTEPLGTTQYQYDAVGNRTRVTLPNGTVIRYGYDNLDRLQSITYPDNSTVTFAYDFDGNRTGMMDALGTSSAQYDELGRMTSYTNAFGQTVGYGYDFNGNRTSLTYPGTKTVSYVYDALNRMINVTDWLSHQTSYSYDPAGRLMASNNPNGLMTMYGFDNANRLTSLGYGPSGIVMSEYRYTLDEIGNHKQVSEIGMLPPVIAPGTANYTYDADNRVTGINGVANTFDLNGNMTAKGPNAFSYDYEDRLQQSTIDGQATQYQYDGLGHRYAKTRGTTTTRYVLDLNGGLSKVLMETDGANTARAYYVYGLGLISRISDIGAVSYYHFDSRGSTIALTDATGVMTDMFAYDPFGNLTNSQGITPNPFKYVGQYGVMDEGNGLHYIRARYYDAQIGRFINKDPKMGNDSDGQSLNRYAYAQNNPVRFVDVSGYNKQEVAGGGVSLNGSSDLSSVNNYLIEGTVSGSSLFDSTKYVDSAIKVGSKKIATESVKMALEHSTIYLNRNGFGKSADTLHGMHESVKFAGPALSLISVGNHTIDDIAQHPERDWVENAARASIDVTAVGINGLITIGSAGLGFGTSVAYDANREKIQDFALHNSFTDWGGNKIYNICHNSWCSSLIGEP